MNYNSLVSDLQTYMLRTDQPYLAKIPDIVNQGIIRIYNNAKDIGFEKIYIQNIAAGANSIAKPANWRETISFSLYDATGNITILQPRSYEYCLTYYPNKATRELPKYYSDSAQLVNQSPYDFWFISPSSNAAYVANIVYLALPLFNGPNPTNFLTDRYPNLLLYSCLMEASLFLNNEEKRAKYEGMYSKELETINRINIDRSTDRTILRDKS